mmetsp:Transcript_34373/g.75764  ORF Transcript_34373/g.75764 Transcript_34373/m.75764 type:complete len:898 (+) Transcript_34373:22-2715(+)
MRNLLALALVASCAADCAVDNTSKTDCGYSGVTQSSCESKGCCWAEVDDYTTPWCFYSTTEYSLSGLQETSTGFSGTLSLLSGSPTYGADIQTLSLDIVFETEDIVRVKITDASKARWEVPESVLPRPHATSRPSLLSYKFTYTASPFSFEIVRLSDLRSLFRLNSLVFKEQYLEVGTTIEPTAATFGLGESTRLTQALTPSTYTLWAIDQPALAFNTNLYSSFPFYLQVVDGSAHGALLLNSNGMDVVLGTDTLTYKTIGGVIDLYVFAGGSPQSVVEQYTYVVGRPTMMPYWSLGFHNCKYGYTSIQQVEQVVANYSAAGIPLDTQWVDIDYMQNYRDFTLDSVAFPQTEVAAFVDSLHAQGMSFVPIIDPGIMVVDGYEAYDQGLKLDLYVKDLQGGNYLGQVWPGPVTFPDFLHPDSASYWAQQIQQFYEKVPVDGLWIDMNEVSNFCNSDGAGQVCENTAPSGCPAPGASQTDCCLQCTTVDSGNTLDFPPYSIKNAFGALSTKTLAMSGVQYGNVSVYDAHNLYGLTEQIATNKALTKARGKRPFLLTRSSFLSTGVHSAKWTGDNAATWEDLQSSIVSILDFNLFGVPMIGADICGFNGNTNEELCARWIELGAFYPFSRNHNSIYMVPQELYLWESVTEAAKNALRMRYQLLPYLYSLFYAAHSSGATVARALWFNYPSDPHTLSINTQFMLGSAVLVSPALTPGATSVTAYFPQNLWYDFKTLTLALDASKEPITKTLDTPLTSVNVHIAGGNVVPMQDAAMTTTAGRLTPFTLLAALCPQGGAYGELYWDDGEQVELTNYLSVSYKVATSPQGGSLTATVTHSTYTHTPSLHTIVVMGDVGMAEPKSVTLNGVDLNTVGWWVGETDKHRVTFHLSVPITESFVLVWV